MIKTVGIRQRGVVADLVSDDGTLEMQEVTCRDDNLPTFNVLVDGAAVGACATEAEAIAKVADVVTRDVSKVGRVAYEEKRSEESVVIQFFADPAHKQLLHEIQHPVGETATYDLKGLGIPTVEHKGLLTPYYRMMAR